MPHPERACEAMLGSTDGLVVFESVVKAVGLSGAAALQGAGAAGREAT
jgi:hypothetical protein